MLTHESKDVSLQALNLVVDMYLKSFEGVYNICTYNIDILQYGRVYNIGTYNINT